MAEKRKDSRGRILKDGENQMQDGRYRFQYIDVTGKRCSVYSWKLVPTDKTPQGKKDSLSLREQEKAILKDVSDGIKTSTNITLNQMFEIYMASKQLKESTRLNYLYMYEKFVSEGFGKRKISNIKYSDIKAFYNSLIREKGLQVNTMGTIHAIFHPVFTLAVRDGYIRTNPTDNVMAEIKKNYKWEEPKRHALTEQEQKAFIDFIANSPVYNHWLPLFTVFLGTGCRVGEIIGLRWQDCDFENKIISINHNLIYRQQENGIYELHITTPKTTAGIRIIPMLTEVRKALLQAKRMQMMLNHDNNVVIDGYTGFIFLNRDGGVYVPETINRAIKRIYTEYNKVEEERAIVEKRKPFLIRHFSVHNLRHTFCTRFCENETNIKVIQEIMGHSDISTTMNVYAEATENKKKEAFKNLEGKIKIS